MRRYVAASFRVKLGASAMSDARTKVRSLADEHLRRGDALGWFDEVYAQAGGRTDAVPWADLAPNAALVAWLDATDAADAPQPRGRALVVGSGLGDDAEELARRGWDTVAFDVSPRAVAWARARFPSSKVRYEQADLLALPGAYIGGFDLVFEAYTLQSLPRELRARAARAVAVPLALGGRLVLVARARDEDAPAGDGPPWPLAKSELVGVAADAGLAVERVDDFVDREDGVRRFLVVLRRPAATAAAER